MKKLFFALSYLCVIEVCMGIASDPALVCNADQLIDRSWNIVLARVVSARVSGGNGCGAVKYEFAVIEALRGNQKENFFIKGRKMHNLDEFSSFANHTENLFWSGSVGRMTVEEDTSIVPSFSVGWTYLVFLDRPYHVKAFEEVSAESDKWLLYVRERIASQKDDATQIRNSAVNRQIKYHVDKLLYGFPEIDKADKISIIKLCYNFGETNFNATNDDIESFFDNQVLEYTRTSP